MPDTDPTRGPFHANTRLREPGTSFEQADQDTPAGVNLVLCTGPTPVERWDPIWLGGNDMEEWLYVTYDADFNLTDIRPMGRKCYYAIEQYIYDRSGFRRVTDDAPSDAADGK